MNNKKYNIFVAILVIILALNYFYGAQLYSKITGQEGRYNIGKLCYSSRTECETRYFKSYLDKIDRLQAEDRTFFSTIIIRGNRIGYVGNCPCPYNEDSRGYSCGRRSSYSKGGEISYCYGRDVSDSQVSSLKDSMIQHANNDLDDAVSSVLNLYHGYITYLIILIAYGILYLYLKNKNLLK